MKISNLNFKKSKKIILMIKVIKLKFKKFKNNKFKTLDP